VGIGPSWEFSLAAPPKVLEASVARFERGYSETKFCKTWSLQLYRYYGEITLAGKSYEVKPGYVSISPSGMTLAHRWYADMSYHLVVQFMPPQATTRLMAFPAVQDLGQQFERIYEDLKEGAFWLRYNRRRTEARFWDVLWRLAEPLSSPEKTTMRHPVLAQAVQYIEANLMDRIFISDMAQELGISHNHLIRLFRQAFGSSVTDYVRSRRVEKATALLESTNMPVKLVAAKVGVPDLQQFNKLMRSKTGMSPRMFRDSNG